MERDPRYYDQPRMFMPQRDWLVDERGEMLVDYVGRFETLQQDFASICQRMGVQASLGHAKPSDRGSYRQYYSAASRQIVAEAFAADIEDFGYGF